MRLQRDDGIRKEKWMEETYKKEAVSLDFFYIKYEFFQLNKSNFCILSPKAFISIKKAIFVFDYFFFFYFILKIHFVTLKNGHDFFEHLKKSELYKTLLERYHLGTTTTNNELTIFFIFSKSLREIFTHRETTGSKLIKFYLKNFLSFSLF